MSFATNMVKNIGKNISKNVSGKYNQKRLDHTKQMWLQLFKKEQLRKQQKQLVI